MKKLLALLIIAGLLTATTGCPPADTTKTATHPKVIPTGSNKPILPPTTKPKPPDEKKPDEKKPDEKKPDEKKPDEKKPDEKKPGEKKPGDK